MAESILFTVITLGTAGAGIGLGMLFKGAIMNAFGIASKAVQNFTNIVITTALTATGVLGGSYAGAKVATEIAGITPPRIVEELINSNTSQDNAECFWEDDLNGKWGIVDYGQYYDTATSTRQDRPELVGGKINFNTKKHSFEIDSKVLDISGTWDCAEDENLKLVLPLDTKMVKENFGAEFEIPEDLPLKANIIAVYKVYYQKDLYDHNEYFALKLITAGVDQGFLSLLDNVGGSVEYEPETTNEIIIPDCDLLDYNCWNQVVARIIKYYTYELELAR